MNELLEAVLEQIKKDVESGDITAVEEFLRIALMYVPEKYLINFLSEEI
jgi:hypothetical protein